MLYANCNLSIFPTKLGILLVATRQKVFVMPNMDDLYLPLMTPGLDNPPAMRQSSVHCPSQQSSVESQDYQSE